MGKNPPKFKGLFGYSRVVDLAPKKSPPGPLVKHQALNPAREVPNLWRKMIRKCITGTNLQHKGRSPKVCHDIQVGSKATLNWRICLKQRDLIATNFGMSSSCSICTFCTRKQQKDAETKTFGINLCEPKR